MPLDISEYGAGSSATTTDDPVVSSSKPGNDAAGANPSGGASATCVPGTQTAAGSRLAPGSDAAGLAPGSDAAALGDAFGDGSSLRTTDGVDLGATVAAALAVAVGGICAPAQPAPAAATVDSRRNSAPRRRRGLLGVAITAPR
jgi:hypothetical protein